MVGVLGVVVVLDVTLANDVMFVFLAPKNRFRVHQRIQIQCAELKQWLPVVAFATSLLLL